MTQKGIQKSVLHNETEVNYENCCITRQSQ